jgi:SNF2 family DNA or RNA helicase
VANIDIPPRMAQTIRIDASKAERELYARISALVRGIAAGEGRARRLTLKNLLAQAGSSPHAVRLSLERLLAKGDLPAGYASEVDAIITHCLRIDRTRKNQRLIDLIRRRRGKLIVFVTFTGSLEQLADLLSRERIPHATFHGRMNNAEKDRQIDFFRQDAEVLLTTEIGGEGRNLQFCHQMVNYDLPWNPMRIEQRIGRIHRLGQQNEVQIYNFCGAGSVEDYILDILDRKINMFEMVIGEIDMILGRIRGEADFSDMVYDIWVNTATEEGRRAAFNQLGSRLKRSKTSYQNTKQLDDDLFGENYEL